MIPTAHTPRIADIDWLRPLRFIGAGSFGIVYQVPGQRGLVVKVGSIWEEEEIAAQRFFAGQHMALPVLDFSHRVSMPRKIQRALCNMHGRPGRKRLGLDTYCACEDSQERSVLLMPHAHPASGFDEGEIRAFKGRVGALCYRHFGRFWDGDVGVFAGHLVALDFGDNDHIFQ